MSITRACFEGLSVARSATKSTGTLPLTGDLDVASDIGRRVGPVIDNARRFGRQREVAEAMQRNLLPPLPEQIQLAARYQPAPAGSQVGGDWYDAFTLRDGTLALVIGDVVCHDLTAAAGMAQLQGILRSLTWDHTGPTGPVVDRLDDAMHAITTVPMATLVLARLEGPDTGPWTLRWTSAGHPPPLLLTPDGNAQYLEAGQGLILGTHLGVGSHRPSAARALPPGSTLLLYTDGLIEAPGSDLHSGLGRLRRHVLASRTKRLTPCATDCPPGCHPAAPTTSPSSPCACPCADRGARIDDGAAHVPAVSTSTRHEPGGTALRVPSAALRHP
ncbi:PP2C family protein-serine/threonine phosphatase [Streptomyces sp. NPDC004129]